MTNKYFLIGIAGGSGSGKTAMAREIKKIAPKDILILSMDSFYKDKSRVSFPERKKLNFDTPRAINYRRLISGLKNLLAGKKVKIPIYDFFQFKQSGRFKKISPKKIIILEGIFALSNPKIRDMIDLKIFIDSDADSRLSRRILRDLRQRRTFSSVEEIIDQYFKTVKPGYERYVYPTREYADIIIENVTDLKSSILAVAPKIREFLKD